jgi:hypothetical protein
MNPLVSILRWLSHPTEKRYAFSSDNRLVVEDSRFTVDSIYDCDWNAAVWKIDITRVAFKNGPALDEIAFAREFLVVLERHPIGHGKVIVLKDGRILGSVLLPRWGYSHS